MYLSDLDIRREITAGNIIYDPRCEANISNSSIDLRLGSAIVREYTKTNGLIHCETEGEDGRLRVERKGGILRGNLKANSFVLDPGDFVLAHTLERVGSASPGIIAQISDKSTLARLGISTFFGAGYIDPGNVLNVTLEIKNNGNIPVVLYEGQHICQIRFAYLNTPCSQVYCGKYLGSDTVQIAS